MNYKEMKLIREKLGLKQNEVERLTGIDTSTLSLYENGLRLPTVKNAMLLQDVYGVKWTEFFEGVDDDRLKYTKETGKEE